MSKLPVKDSNNPNNIYPRQTHSVVKQIISIIVINIQVASICTNSKRIRCKYGLLQAKITRKIHNIILLSGLGLRESRILDQLLFQMNRLLLACLMIIISIPIISSSSSTLDCLSRCPRHCLKEDKIIIHKDGKWLAIVAKNKEVEVRICEIIRVKSIIGLTLLYELG